MADDTQDPKQGPESDHGHREAPRPGGVGDLPWDAAAEAAAQLASKLAGVAAQVAQEGMKQGVKYGAKATAKQAMRGDNAWFFGGGGAPWERGAPWGRPRRGRGPWGPPPPGGWDRAQKAKRGDVRAAILSLLAEEPRNGYQIIQEAEERTEGAWRPSPGAVYPALQQLSDEGLIEGVEENGRKTYHLTDEGRTHVAEHGDELGTPWADRSAPVDGSIADLFKEAAQMGAALMQVVHAGSDEQVAQAKRLVATTRRRLYGLLAEDAGRAADEEPET